MVNIVVSQILARFSNIKKRLDSVARRCRAQNGSKIILLDDKNTLHVWLIGTLPVWVVSSLVGQPIHTSKLSKGTEIQT